MSTVNLIIALSAQALTEFKAKRSNEDYTGPMDEQTFKTLSRMADLDTVQQMFKTVTAGGKTYTAFSLYLEGSAAAKNAIDDLTAKWPTHFIVVGAFDYHTGEQIRYPDTLDDNGDVVEVGEIVYPLHAQAYKLMPDLVTYDSEGNETSRIPPTSNADLRDINLLAGQSPRQYT